MNTKLANASLNYGKNEKGEYSVNMTIDFLKDFEKLFVSFMRIYL